MVRAAREAIDGVRSAARDGEPVLDAEQLASRAAEAVQRLRRPSLRRVVNATGVVVHTNLGRAPISERALAAVSEVARGYSNLEYDLERGVRGSRHAHVERLICELTGAEAAIAVNNNAAAVLLALAALAGGGEVVISRGQLVEIGGSFRIPEILAASGARLVEVGTTNRTRLDDYERAIGDETAALMRVHSSNFRTVGFTEEVSIAATLRAGAFTRAGDDRRPRLRGAGRTGGRVAVVAGGGRAVGAAQPGRGRGRRLLLGRQAARRARRPG